MQINLEDGAAALVVVPVGRLDFGAAGAFQQALEQAVGAAAGRALVVDCAGLEYVSSAGLRGFLVGARAAQGAGLKFFVCALRKPVAEVFAVSGFARIIPLLADRAAAEAAAAG